MSEPAKSSIATKFAEDHTSVSMTSARLKVLGSPRYNDEWVEALSGLVPEFAPNEGKGKLKVALFLRDGNYSIFIEEFLYTIKLILQFPNIYLAAKHHTRSVAWLAEQAMACTHAGSRFVMVYDDVSSVSMLKWADVVVDLGITVVFQAVKRGIPVLSMEYLHPNY